MTATSEGTEAVELFTPEFLDNPHPVYDLLREARPVCKVRMPSGEDAWLVTRYEDVRRGLADPRLSNDQTKLQIVRPYDALPDEVESAITTDMLNVDPPVHDRLRRVISNAFTARRAEEFRPWIRAKCDELLDGLEGRESFDVIEDYAAPMVAAVTEELLGVPPGDSERFRVWGKEIATTILQRRDDPLLRPTLSLHDYVKELIDYKTANPADDLLTRIVRAHENAELSTTELTSMIHLLLIAGQEGPANIIGSGVFLLLLHADQMELVRTDPGLVRPAVEEFLRLEAPLGLSIYRWCAEPYEIGGAVVPAREPMIFSILSSGRDVAKFPAGDGIDVRRGDHNHLGFGRGTHYCIGAPLGRVEAQEAISRLLHRHGHLSLACDASDVRWKTSVITRGLAHLPVRVTPGQVGTAS